MNREELTIDLNESNHAFASGLWTTWLGSGHPNLRGPQVLRANDDRPKSEDSGGDDRPKSEDSGDDDRPYSEDSKDDQIESEKDKKKDDRITSVDKDKNDGITSG